MRCFVLGLVLLSASCAGPGDAVSSDPAEGPDARTHARPTAGERLAGSAAAEELTRLATLVGAWRLEVEEYRDGALEPLAAGRAEVTPALAGRFFEWRTEVLLQGQEVRSRGLLGYDRERELFELHWVSELSSAQRIARGRGRADRGGLTLESADLDPETGGVRRVRTVLRIEDGDGFTMRQDTWDPDLADWRSLVRTSYTRLSPGDGSSRAPQPR